MSVCNEPGFAPRPRVLLAGQGPPRPGGIPTFLADLLDSATLHAQVELDFLDLPPAPRAELGTMSVANIRTSVGHVRMVGRRARSAEIVHVNVAGAPHLPLLRAMACAAAARRAGAAVVLHIHASRVEEATDNAAYRAMLRLAAARVGAVLVVSDAAAVAVRRAVPNVQLVPNGVRIDRFPVVAHHRTSDRLDEADDRPLLLFAGTVSREKGLFDLRDALAMLAAEAPDGTLPVRVTIVGDSSQTGPGVDDEIRRAYEAAGLDDVRFVGARDRWAVIDMLPDADIYCRPSHCEGAPLGVLEAMACGLPVIATTVGEIPLQLDHGKVGVLVPPHQPRQLATAIAELARDPARRAELGRAARTRVEQHYRLDTTVHHLVDVYRSATLTESDSSTSRFKRPWRWRRGNQRAAPSSPTSTAPTPQRRRGQDDTRRGRPM